MKYAYLIVFFINIIIAINTYTMNQSMILNKNTPTTPVWLLTLDNKKIAIPHQDACHSSYLSINNNILPQGSSEHFPISVDITKKDILFFQEIIHKPACYDNIKKFPQKKYDKALSIASGFGAPLLYADLLKRLPLEVLQSITKQYIELSNISHLIQFTIWGEKSLSAHDKLKQTNNEAAKEKVRNKYRLTLQELGEPLENNLNDLKNKITLTQAILLNMICSRRPCYSYPMYIAPHMPGHQSLILFMENEQMNFVSDYLPIECTYGKTKKGIDVITTMHFNV